MSNGANGPQSVEIILNKIVKTNKGYLIGSNHGGITILLDNHIIDKIHEDLKLRDTPTPLLTQEQYKERMAAENMLPEDL